MDSSGNLYVADYNNNIIRKWTASNHAIATLVPASSGLAHPTGVAVDAAGNVYYSDQTHNLIGKWTASSQTLSTVVSSGLSGPAGIAVDAAGNLYIADRNDNAIKKFSTGGTLSTLASGLNAPFGVAVDLAGNVYFCDTLNSLVKKWSISTAQVSTLASAALAAPLGLAVDGQGNVYFADGGNNAVKKWTATTAQVTTLVSTGLSTPIGIAVDSSGNVYLADANNNAVKKINVAFETLGMTSQTISGGTVTGTVQVGFLPANATAPWSATPAAFWIGFSAASGTGAGTVGITFTANTGVVSRTGTISLDSGLSLTVNQAGTAYVPANAVTLATGLGGPRGVAADAQGNVYIADGGSVKEWNASSQLLSTLVSTGLNLAFGVAVDGFGDVYIADYSGNAILKRSASGQLSTLVSFSHPGGLAVDGQGNVYIDGIESNAITGWSASTHQVSTLAGGFGGPRGVAVDLVGNVYIADLNNSAIKEWVAASAQVVPLVTTGSIQPYGAAADGAGNVFFSDGRNGVIEERLASGGQVATLATGLSSPYGAASDGSGNVYFSDLTDGIVEKLPAAFVPSTSVTELSTAGSDSLPPVFPANTVLTGVFAPTSDQTWLTIGSVVSGVVNFSFTANTSGLPRTANITLLGRSIAVTQGLAQTITFTSPGNVTPGTYPLIAAASSGLPIRFTSGTTSICTVAGSVLTAAAPGTCSITASQPGNTTYTPAPDVVQTFFVAPSSQTITFGALPNVPVSTASVNLTATASSTQPVQYISNTTTVCTVSGSTATMLISGGCSITATQPGNTDFAAAPPVTQAFTVLFADTGADGSVYYSAAVNLVAQHGITAGCGSNDYCPTQNVTRYQMAIFMVRAVYGSDNFTYSTTPYFADVPFGATGFKWIQKMFELGITGGCSNVNGVRNYCPNDTITRAQLAIFLMRARYGTAGAPDFPSTAYFTDEPASDTTYFKWIQRMKLDGITGGCGDGTTYCPASPVIRGDMAIFIMRGAFNQLLAKGTPVISSISPSALGVGTSGTFTVTGANTNFVQGTTTINPIPGVTVGTVTVSSPTSLTVQLTAAANAVTQPYSVLAITGSEEAVLPNGLNIAAVATGGALPGTKSEVPAPGVSPFEYLPADVMGSGIFEHNSGVAENGHEFAGDNPVP